VLSALIVMGNPISFGAFLGDWSCYIPADTRPSRLMGATFLGQLATLVPCLFGVGTATIVYLALLFAFPEPRYVFGPAAPGSSPRRRPWRLR
jgi:purine-cytosine permease-like protein